MTERKIARALVSVSNKDHLDTLAETLKAHKIEVLSTGGTAKSLRALGVNVLDVQDVTHFPEMLDGRVKTLHPAVHGGILAKRSDPTHMAALKDHKITPIDLVVINLYPFEQTLEATNDLDELIENIDIGGPAMVRASAKNHEDVTIITSPSDYAGLKSILNAHDGATTLKFRSKLAAKAFAHTAYYDSLIAEWMRHDINFTPEEAPVLPNRISLPLKNAGNLRYGENPHQSATFYTPATASKSSGGDYTRATGLAAITQHQGKELSYNNLNDTDAALSLISEFGSPYHQPGSNIYALAKPACVIVKHANPCGVATGKTLHEAYERALASDPTSAFGGIIALNQEIDAATATAMSKIFTEVIIAPKASPEAMAIIEKKKNLRLLTLEDWPQATLKKTEIKSVLGGYLVQTRDDFVLHHDDLKVVTERAPTSDEMADLTFAFTIAKHVKSNTIVYARDQRTLGIGAGQMSRVDAAIIGVHKAKMAHLANMQNDMGGLHTRDNAKVPTDLPLKGAVAASDAFFPFADGLDVLIEAGCTAVIQPGGSMRDQEVIDAANAAGIAMVMAGVRHFKH